MADERTEHQAWVWGEFRDAELGDPRRTQRLIRLAQTLCSNPEESIPQACGRWGQTKAAYRFFDNPHVDPHEILRAHRRATLQRIRLSGTQLVLVVQDTTQFDFTKHRQTQGLGPTGAPGLQGFFSHHALGLLPDDGTPLGLLAWYWWARPEQQPHAHERPPEEKESFRWIRTLRESTADLPAGVRAVTIADREADIFTFLHQAQQWEQLFLIRAAHDRTVAAEGEIRALWQAAEQGEVLGTVGFLLPRGENRPERPAVALLQVAEVTLTPPRHLAGQDLAPVRARAILAREIQPPDGEQPFHWLLLTNLPVRTAEEAATCLRWYTYRWRIERFHFTLKSGCAYEKLQLETADRLWRALAVYSVVAWRLLYTNLVVRSQPEAPCTIFLQEDEWKALACHHLKTPLPPAQPPDARTALRWIAQLGGFLARKSDGEPGVKTLWRGFRRLQDLVEMWRILRPRE